MPLWNWPAHGYVNGINDFRNLAALQDNNSNVQTSLPVGLYRPQHSWLCGRTCILRQFKVTFCFKCFLYFWKQLSYSIAHFRWGAKILFIYFILLWCQTTNEQRAFKKLHHIFILKKSAESNIWRGGQNQPIKGFSVAHLLALGNLE